MTIAKRRGTTTGALLLATAWLAGCGDRPPGDPLAALPAGYWQATITLPGGDIETGVEISFDGKAYGVPYYWGYDSVV